MFHDVRVQKPLWRQWQQWEANVRAPKNYFGLIGSVPPCSVVVTKISKFVLSFIYLLYYFGDFVSKYIVCLSRIFSRYTRILEQNYDRVWTITSGLIMKVFWESMNTRTNGRLYSMVFSIFVFTHKRWTFIPKRERKPAFYFCWQNFDLSSMT